MILTEFYIWIHRYVIGMEDLKSGISFGWLSSLATTTKSPFLLAIDQSTNTTVIAGGPPTISIYLTSLYFTMVKNWLVFDENGLHAAAPTNPFYFTKKSLCTQIEKKYENENIRAIYSKET